MPKLLNIHFVLPFSGRKPVGGFKVVYEYANELVRRGHAVRITHAAGLYLGVNPNDKAWLNIAKFFIFGLLGNYRPHRWFTLDSRVKTVWRPSLKPFLMPPADFIVATSWETAEWVAKYPEQKGKKVYLIQGLENWLAPTERVIATWKSISTKIVISRWLGQIAEQINEPYHYIPNGLCFNNFGVDIEPENRNPKSILMLYHGQAIKGTSDGLRALEIVKAKEPEVAVTLFGVQPPPPEALPPWVRFELRPSPMRLRELYNSHAIFASPSLSEGWALPPAEAMQCGCATVLTDIGGHEYATEGITSLMCPVHEPIIMAERILQLIQDRDLRIALARSGSDSVSQYTWEKATSQLVDVLSENFASQN